MINLLSRKKRALDKRDLETVNKEQEILLMKVRIAQLADKYPGTQMETLAQKYMNCTSFDDSLQRVERELKNAELVYNFHLENYENFQEIMMECVERYDRINDHVAAARRKLLSNQSISPMSVSKFEDDVKNIFAPYNHRIEELNQIFKNSQTIQVDHSKIQEITRINFYLKNLERTIINIVIQTYM